MSEFSEAFTELIKEKDIQVYPLVKYCNMDRSTMYKIISGKRKPPSEPIFNKICDFMHLSPLEYDKFQTAYRITLMGKENYYRRRNVEDFILSFPSESNALLSSISDHLQMKYVGSALPSKDAFLSNQLECNQALHHILIKEGNKHNGKIALLLQPDHEFLFGVLANLTPDLASSPISVEHIICLSKKTQLDPDNRLYNLSYLKNILPLYISNIAYKPYYFYDDITAHYYNHNAFSCMILTTEYAMSCTSDYSTGILHNDAQTVQAMWKLYYSYQSKCMPLFHTAASIEEYMSSDNMGQGKTSSYFIQPEPCLLPFITPQMMENVIYPHIPERSSLLSKLQQFVSESKERITSPKMHYYHTREGLISFAETGRLIEIPNNFYKPFSKKERILLLQQLLTACHTCCYRLLKKPLNILPNNFHLCVNENSGYLLFTNGHKKEVCLIFREPSMVLTFLDYASWISENNYLASEEESKNFISEVIQNLSREMQ